MSSFEFGWEPLLHTDAPLGCWLKAALFTTYDRPDERILAEHLLPLLLKLGCEPENEGLERQSFLVELDRRLKQLHDQIVVVSSMAREEPMDLEERESGTYGWIWRSIRHLTVGSHRKAVQHAKLWLFHWGAVDQDSGEYVELVVSSTNLTRAAFRGQLQAAWRACIRLRPQGSEARLARWGVLPEFLRKLAESAGDGTRLAPFVELLARADCPAGVTFLASVPGTHSRQALRRTPWGAAGLRKIAPSGKGTVRVSILSPFIGSWSVEALNQWCFALKTSSDRLELVWIDRNHPWACAGRWLLPKATLKTLTAAGVILLHLRHEPDDDELTDLFHEEHRSADERWSHAKVYSIKRGASRRLLVTSANFSTSAWGGESRGGKLTIENFELGVCVERASWPFDKLETFGDEKDVATVSELPSWGSVLIMWARAAWDGKKVHIECRCEAKREVAGKVQVGDEWILITNWTVATDGRLHSTLVPWVDAKRPPSSVLLKCGQETASVPIFDERSPREREDARPPEVDENIVQFMRDELLFEQYGGRVAADIEDEELKDTAEEQRDNPTADAQTADGAEGEIEEDVIIRADSYSVPAFDIARRHLDVVDSWAGEVFRAAKDGNGKFEQELLRRDGELLIEAFERQAARDAKKETARGIGAKLAVEELVQRLKHYP